MPTRFLGAGEGGSGGKADNSSTDCAGIGTVLRRFLKLGAERFGQQFADTAGKAPV